MSNAFFRDAVRAVRNHKHELAEDGSAYIPTARAFIGGVFGGRYAAPGEGFGPAFYSGANRVVGEGLTKIVNLLAGHASSASLYLAPFSGNVEPAAGWLGSNWAALATEFTTYTPATRPPWTTVPATAGALTNVAALAAATITFGAGGPFTIRGCSLVESATKNGTTGPLIAASRFDADLAGMATNGKLALQYDLAAIDESDA